jgi:hypothetical protein
MCDERERLIGFVYAECDAEERRAIQQHLDECGTCRVEIGGLRDVRQDLLAWDVPEAPATWRPYVAPVVVPWYRQVPGWALAAAAGVMFLIGAAGGLVTQALVGGRAAAPATVVRDAAPAGVVRTSDLTALEQRIVDQLRSELAAEQAAVRDRGAARPAVDADQLLRRVSTMVGESERRSFEAIQGLNNGLGVIGDSLRRDVDWLKQVVNQGGGR